MAKFFKPHVFIGSSVEGSRAAIALQTLLAGTCETTVWSQNAFELGKSNLENLSNFLDHYDFAVFVASPDDQLMMREQTSQVARDNIIFEIGLFMGGLGVSRTMFISPRGNFNFHLPSDLDGIAHIKADFGKPEEKLDLDEILCPAATQIKHHIKKQLHVTRPTKKLRKNLVYAGVICFRVNKGTIEYLLINTTQGRKIFPKGDVKHHEYAAVQAVDRIAYREAGAKGVVLADKSRIIKYYNDKQQQMNRMEVFIMDISTVISPGDTFRNPQWYTLNEAITVITESRAYNTTIDLMQLMEWAERTIARYIKMPRPER